MKTKSVGPFRQRLYEVIFEAETPAGKTFDVVLLWIILLSVVAVLLESVPSLRDGYGQTLKYIEWVFTALFCLEYLVRIYCVRRPIRYIFSFFGIVDLLSILPTFLVLVFGGAHSLMVIRGLRLLRIFRVFKLGRYTGEARILLGALKAGRPKITVFLGAVLGLALIMGALMYLIEGADSGFTSIPLSIYWAIVTMTTVGYGDIVPQTPLGQLIASIVMISGYAIIAVPTGIVTAEIAKADKGTNLCDHCEKRISEPLASFCPFCGTTIN